MSDRKLLLITIIVLIIIIIIIQISPIYASDDNIIRGDINRLDARVSRLETAILDLRQQQSNSRIRESSIGTSPPIIEGEAIGRSEPLFERLSTLVIELKERVMNLEKRMTQIEKR
ncbi:hypothetical protein [Aphanothece sacrum]|uniref:Uncharacterized protein n=1 Tax=Aphanothece sacrum FPU1 TaxID=1920663 RepID=A0A401IGG1_APHSA|nr:hypothetical protein [Aphanothece sacrum]GBF80375.1 hypothetical protein AsFPU1_1776 [Aphanothece sacrum FPU1]GBF84918.1 hypothetical protein AsFPU3_1973 [Aphanothece sacrum FPU3]